MFVACSRAALYPSANDGACLSEIGDFCVMLETIMRMSAMIKRLSARMARIFLDELDCVCGIGVMGIVKSIARIS